MGVRVQGSGFRVKVSDFLLCFIGFKINRPSALYRLIEKTHTGENRPRMGFFVKAHTTGRYEFLPSVDIGQVVYCFGLTGTVRS